jgi:Fur family ferric uptake transcriptional regulator
MKHRNTRQKEIINKEITRFKTFFSAEDLYNNVKEIDKNIGLATVYRHLKTLRKNKNIFFYTCGGKIVYSKEKRSHCHFYCEKTGEEFHFDITTLDFLEDKIPGSITSVQLEVRGSCNKCSKS